MRCPECNVKWRYKRDLMKNKCHKCGHKMTIRDFLPEEFLQELKDEKNSVKTRTNLSLIEGE